MADDVRAVPESIHPLSLLVVATEAELAIAQALAAEWRAKATMLQVQVKEQRALLEAWEGASEADAKARAWLRGE